MGRFGTIILLLVMSCTLCMANSSRIPENPENISFNFPAQDSLDWADYYYNIHRYNRALTLYEKNLENTSADKIHVLKRIALSEAALEHPKESTQFLNDYLQEEFNPNFLLNEGFDPIRTTSEFKAISDRVIPRVTIWSLIYLFVATVGFYVVIIICFNKQIHRTPRFLIAVFIFLHSFFILHIAINSASYNLQYPHTYLMTTWASFLYGPLLYLYFKSTLQKYQLKLRDLLHLTPTLILLGFLTINIYLNSHDTKLELMLQRIQNGLNPQDSNRLVLLVVLKIISLTLYGYFIGRVYRKGRKEKLLQQKKLIWQKNVYHIHILYIITYTGYGILISNQFNSGPLFDISVATMAMMVLYVGYSANIQPDVFSGAYAYTNRLFPKYQKSGLTPSLSLELKQNLLILFGEEKIYKENNINLDMVAQRLNTTRHNTSQIINEHFEVSFHEFVNMYRIQEAKQLLLEDKARRLNIINVAYEVGYNNKVTFNKAFKKDTQLTPSQYQKSVMRY